MQRKRAKELAAGMNGLNVKVYAKCGENGRLFGSIGAAEISAGLKEQHGLDVDKKKIRLDEPIKALGKLGTELKKYGPNVVLVYGGGSIKKNGIYCK